MTDPSRIGRKSGRADLRSALDFRLRLQAPALDRKPHISLRPRDRWPGAYEIVDLGADLVELLLDRLGLVLGHAFLDRLGRALDEVLGFLQTEAGDLADDLDDLDLVRRRLRSA